MADAPDPQRAERDPDPRVTFANERTFLAWNRTALTMVAGALAVAQFLGDVAEAARLAIAAPLLILGGTIAVTSHGRWRASQRALRRGEQLPRSPLPAVLTAGIAVVVAVAGVVVLREMVA